MTDNFGSLRATLQDCEQRTVEYPGIGEVTGIVPSGDTPTLTIEDIDTEGSLDDMLSSQWAFIAISCVGQIPDIKFESHIDGQSEGSILTIEKTDEHFKRMKFYPQSGSIDGYVDTPVLNSLFDRLNTVDKFENPDLVVQSSFIIQVLGGFDTDENGMILKDGDGADERKVFDLVIYNAGGRYPLARTKVVDLDFGSLRKRLVLSLHNDTCITSFSYGSIPVSDSGDYSTEERTTPKTIDSLIEGSSGQEQENYTKIKRILSTPTKIFNTEGIL